MGLTTIDLIKQWQNAGIETGDTLCLHSDIIRTAMKMDRSGGAKQVVANIVGSFRDVLGSEGTFIVPTFFPDWPQKPFDVRNTPSKTGAISEYVRTLPGAVRTGHPTHSYVAIGKEAKKFERLDNMDAYGADSPFALMHQMDAKLAYWDVPLQHSGTFIHYVEEMLDHSCPWRFHKEFTGEYTDWDGKYYPRKPYDLFVRNDGIITNVEPLDELFWAKGLYTGDLPKIGSGLRVIRAEDFYCTAAELIFEGRAKGIIYDVESLG